MVSADPSSMHTRQQSASFHSRSSLVVHYSSQIAAVCHHTIGQTKTNIEIGGTTAAAAEDS